MEQILITLKNLNGKMTLADELRNAGVSFLAPCGGKGECGKCKVIANGEEVLACQTKLQGDVEVLVAKEITAECYQAAVDIGTTNVAVLLDGKKYIKEPNVLQSYGADVITRIEACKDGKFQEMHEKLVHQIQRLTVGAKERFIAGNTVMECFYAGIDPTPISVPPYASPELFQNSKELTPCVGGYVGGDIVAGLLASGAADSKKTVLYVDIGTNGEIAVGNQDGFVTCACAAGPAFEYGAAGLLGSQVVDEIARLLKNGQIGKSGKLSGESVLTQEDIRSVQYAKAAVRAGIETALAGREMDILILAGDFGKELNLESAYAIGLLPQIREVSIAGNSSLEGAQLGLTDSGKKQLKEVAVKCQYLELTTSHEFSDLYLKYLNF